MKKILDQVEQEIAARSISEDEISDILSSFDPAKNRRIIGGYCSVAVVDREGHKISIPALKEAVDRFMQNPEYKNCNVFHSDVTVGKVLPAWTDPDTGKVYKTEVDDTGWKVCCELRNDIEIADKVWDEILKGTIRSFSIAGSSKSKRDVYEQGQSFTSIDELDIAEITLCCSEGSKIYMHGKKKNIENVSVGDKVLTHRNRFKSVTQIFAREYNDKLIEITLENRKKLRVTPNHLIMLSDRSWKRAGELKEGDDLEKVKSGIMKIIKIKEVDYEGKVYNLEVERDNTYICEGVTVHNCEEPVNQMSKFSILWDPDSVNI